MKVNEKIISHSKMMLTLFKVVYRGQNVAHDFLTQVIRTIHHVNMLNNYLKEEPEIDFQPGEWLFVHGESELLYQEKLKLRQTEISNLNHRDVVKGLGRILQWSSERFKDLPMSIKSLLTESRISNDMRYSTIRITLDDVFIRMRPHRPENISLFQTREHDEIAKLMHLASTPASEEGLNSAVIAQMLWIIEVRSFIAVDREFDHMFDKMMLRTQIFDALIKRWCEAWKACKRTIYNQSRLPTRWREEYIKKQIATKPADAKFNDGPVSDHHRRNHWLMFNKSNENGQSSDQSSDNPEANLVSLCEANEEKQIVPLINDFSRRKKMLESSLIFYKKPTKPTKLTNFNKLKVS
jgi:hypothetical protein